MVRRLKILLLTGVLVLCGEALRAQTPALSEYEVKAAFLFNFAKFVEWPPEAFEKSGDEFVVGIMGEDPFQKEVEQQFEGETIQDKKLVFKQLSDAQEALGCQVVFISVSEEDRLKEVLDQLEGHPVLTVSDMKKFVHRGGMVGFVRERKKVGFSINRTVAESAGLKISSQLLKLAKRIVKSYSRAPLG